MKKNEQLEREALDLRCQMIGLQNEQSYTKQYCSDKQRAHQQEPDQLGLFPQVNQPLRDLGSLRLNLLWPIAIVSQATPKHPDQKRAAKQDHTISELEERIQKLETNLSQVLESETSTLKELERCRQQYQDQVDLNKALQRKLERSACSG